MVAQRYPRDFNGVIAGAPWLKPSAQVVAMNQQLDGAADLAPKLQMISAAMMRGCDASDGVTDGLISNPEQCRQDPAELLCSKADAPDCLTTGQLRTLRAIYDGAKSADGKRFFPGYARGGEYGWMPAIVPREHERSSNDLLQWAFLRGFVFGTRYDSRTLQRPAQTIVPPRIARLVDVRADFEQFRAAGGRLLMWHGWDDARLSPFYSVEFYRDVQRRLAREAPQMGDFFRLFMAPGVAHCSGGRGPSNFDALQALEQWVEQGVAPARIVASGVTDAGVMRSRPLCPYPAQAVYSGHGSADEAASFICRS
jgi:feruloyl esterase